MTLSKRSMFLGFQKLFGIIFFSHFEIFAVKMDLAPYFSNICHLHPPRQFTLTPQSVKKIVRVNLSEVELWSGRKINRNDKFALGMNSGVTSCDMGNKQISNKIEPKIRELYEI